MRTGWLAVLLLAAAGPAAADAARPCGDAFGTEARTLDLFRVTRGDVGARLYFRPDPEAPPCTGAGCARGPYIVVGDEVITERRRGPYVCAWYKPAAARYGTSGWLPADALASVPISTDPPRAGWRGAWVRDRPLNLPTTLDITPTGDGRLKVEGSALYAADRAAVARGAVNTGDIDDTLEVRGNLAGAMLGGGSQASGDDCRIGLALIADYIVALDNGACGGLNVTFSGVYRR